MIGIGRTFRKLTVCLQLWQHFEQPALREYAVAISKTWVGRFKCWRITGARIYVAPVALRDASLSLVWALYLLSPISSFRAVSCEEANMLQLMFVDRQSPLYYPLILSLL